MLILRKWIFKRYTYSILRSFLYESWIYYLIFIILDVDALKDVARAVEGLKTKDNSLLIITHYKRLLDLIVPDFVHIMKDG